jgi:nucleoside-diphosphate-sugar epimerase
MRKRMEGKTVIVTGGAGFIGSHLIDGLIEKNKVICIDNLATGSNKNIKQIGRASCRERV